MNAKGMAAISEPMVAIVTPSFNQGHYIRATIESVLAQDYPHIDYIVVDGGSTDETLSVLREYDGRVRWISEPDRGQTHAINKGLALTRGEIATWVNSDDLLLPGAVSAAVAAFKEDSRLAFVYGNAHELDGRGEFVRNNYPPAPNVWELVHGWDYLVQPACFFRREKLEAVGGLDETLHWAMDYDLFLRLALRYPIKHIAAFLAEYRVYDECKSCSGGWKRFLEISRIIRRYSILRCPPVLLLYAWECIHVSLRSWAHRTRPPLRSRINAIIAKLQHSVDRFLNSRVRRWDVDGWVASALGWYLVDEEKDVIEVRGHIPEEECLGGVQHLRLIVDGVLVRDAKVASGDFRMLTSIKRSQHGSGVHVRLEATRSFVPARCYRDSKDKRQLAFCLYHLDWVRATKGVDAQWSRDYFDDGWAGPEFTTVVQTSAKVIEIAGQLPDYCSKLLGQTLAITINGQAEPSVILKLDFGPFRHTLSVPTPDVPFELSVMASRWFVPAEEENSNDRRRLAFRLNEIRSVT